MPPRPNKRVRMPAATTAAGAYSPPDIEDFRASTATCVQSSHTHSRSYHQFAPEEKEPIRKRLLEWYDMERREMPWRKDIASETRPGQRAYEVWVSEIMCQQTQVATVIDYYNRWMKAFPTIFDLAKADLETVNKLWTGLGYYSRAKRLWEGAQKVVEQFGGILPEDAAKLEQEVPGVGRYTAGAISSIAYGHPAELVDGNVVRVLSRLRAVGGDVKASATVGLFWELAQCLVPTARPGDHNQAMMELGATVCTPQNPKCGACPITKQCRAFEEVRAYSELKKGALTNSRIKTGDAKRSRKTDDLEACDICLPFNPTNDEPYAVTRYPLKAVKKPPRNEECAVCILERSWTDEDGKEISEFLLAKRPEEGLLAGLWEFPSVELGAPVSMVAATADLKISSRKDDDSDDDEGSDPDADPDAEFVPHKLAGKSKSKAAGVGSTTTATYQDRSRKMDAYLRDSFGLVLDEEANVGERTMRRVDLGNVVHLFSHIRKVYHVEWVLVKGWGRENGDSFTRSLQKKTTAIPAAIPCISPQWMWIMTADIATAAIPTGLKKAFKVLERHRAKEDDKNRGEKSKTASKTGLKKAGGKTLEREKGVRDISQFFVKKT